MLKVEIVNVKHENYKTGNSKEHNLESYMKGKVLPHYRHEMSRQREIKILKTR
jgi:hypothetical protein